MGPIRGRTTCRYDRRRTTSRSASIGVPPFPLVRNGFRGGTGWYETGTSYHFPEAVRRYGVITPVPPVPPEPQGRTPVLLMQSLALTNPTTRRTDAR
jgi:hypothetical protein